MQLFEDLIKCKDCMNNINNKCILFLGKNVTYKKYKLEVANDKILN